MDEAVNYLESALLPELAAFGEALVGSIPGITTKTFSHRHASTVYSLGLSCFPAGSDELDERCVALYVNVIDQNELLVQGFITWQAPSFHQEAETAAFANPSIDDLVAFCREARELFGTLETAASKI